jgi:hypothetical protein
MGSQYMKKDYSRRARSRPGSHRGRGFQEEDVVEAEAVLHESALSFVDELREVEGQAMVDAEHRDLIVNVASGQWT